MIQYLNPVLMKKQALFFILLATINVSFSQGGIVEFRSYSNIDKKEIVIKSEVTSSYLGEDWYLKNIEGKLEYIFVLRKDFKYSRFNLNSGKHYSGYFKMFTGRYDNKFECWYIELYRDKECTSFDDDFVLTPLQKEVFGEPAYVMFLGDRDYEMGLKPIGFKEVYDIVGSKYLNTISSDPPEDYPPKSLFELAMESIEEEIEAGGDVFQSNVVARKGWWNETRRSQCYSLGGNTEQFVKKLEIEVFERKSEDSPYEKRSDWVIRHIQTCRDEYYKLYKNDEYFGRYKYYDDAYYEIKMNF